MGHEFKLLDKVVLVDSGEKGVIVGCASYTVDAPSYYVRYRGGDGRQVKVWWNASDLKLDES